MKPVILSLCDLTGAWAKPYADSGDYDVRCYDVARDSREDVRLLRLPFEPVHGILAAPPCTAFARSGNRWIRTDDEMRDALAIVDACVRIATAARPRWWALENPPGTLSYFLGRHRYSFDPCDFGDPYKKKTQLWGDFAPPIKNPVEPTEGSKMHLIGPVANRADLRSITPPGFARAFFEANP